ncbi:MAG: hypothetical protein KGO22_14585 [Gammaproteobacteria bacterium]|nr:hypothetical protein [Gammaproteobacteria bacterium]
MNARTRQSAARGLLIVLCLLSGPGLQNLPTAAADSPAPSTAAVTGQQDCRDVDSKAARERAVVAARRSQYRQAGQCYLAAGDKPAADLQFAKAAAADAAVTRRRLAVGVKQAKVQFSQLREAFASH